MRQETFTIEADSGEAFGEFRSYALAHRWLVRNGLVIEWGKAGEETQRVSFGEKTLMIGRAANCTLRLRGWGIAREHALIFKIDAQSYIRDLGGIGRVS